MAGKLAVPSSDPFDEMLSKKQDEAFDSMHKTISRIAAEQAVEEDPNSVITSGDSGKRIGNIAYPSYSKTSPEAIDFRKAFSSARKSGKKVFDWNGRSYSTKLKGEE